MYEIINGTKRLSRALVIAATDPSTLTALTHWLNYATPEQLQQDIDAMADYIAASNYRPDP